MDNSDAFTQRTEMQRERILNAAERCFTERGFQTVDMAMIAQTAGMDPGLIHRYYPDIGHVVVAIVRRELEVARETIRTLYAAPDLVAGAFGIYVSWRTSDPKLISAAVLLETSAHARRDPELARVLAQADAEMRFELGRWLAAPIEQGGRNLPPALADVRALSVQVFMDGLAIRAMREPGLDEVTLKAALQELFENIGRPA